MKLIEQVRPKTTWIKQKAKSDKEIREALSGLFKAIKKDIKRL